MLSIIKYYLLNHCTSSLVTPYYSLVEDVVTLFGTQWRQNQIARYQLYNVKCSSILYLYSFKILNS